MVGSIFFIYLNFRASKNPFSPLPSIFQGQVRNSFHSYVGIFRLLRVQSWLIFNDFTNKTAIYISSSYDNESILFPRSRDLTESANIVCQAGHRDIRLRAFLSHASENEASHSLLHKAEHVLNKTTRLGLDAV